MAHPTDAELRKLGNEILDLLVKKTKEEADSLTAARQEQVKEDYGDDPNDIPMESGEDMWAEVESYIRSNYSWLPDTYAEFAKPAPDDFNGLVSSCVSAMTLLEPSLGDAQTKGPEWVDSDTAAKFPVTVKDRVTEINSYIDDWHGSAADAFHTSYMNKFNTSLGYQHDIAFSLAASIEADQKIYENVGQDILDIGQKTKDALNAVTDKDPTGAVIFLTVAAAVATVASAGTAAPVAAGLLVGAAATSSTAAGIIGATAEKPKKQDIEGSTTIEIMSSMSGAITDLYSYITTEEKKISDALLTLSGSIGSLRKQIEMPLPADLTNMADAGYSDVTGDKGFYE